MQINLKVGQGYRLEKGNSRVKNIELNIFNSNRLEEIHYSVPIDSLKSVTKSVGLVKDITQNRCQGALTKNVW